MCRAVFRPAPALGYGLMISVWLAPTPAHDALRSLLRSLVRLLPLWCKNRNLGFLRLWSLVPIRTVFGTMAVLVGSIVAVAVVRNFAGVVIGTGCVWLTFYGWLRMINRLKIIVQVGRSIYC